MPGYGVLPSQNTLSEVHEEVTLVNGKATKATIRYRYMDGAAESFDYTPGQRPQPSRPSARNWMKGLVDNPAPPLSATALPPAPEPASSGAASPASPGPVRSACSGCAAPRETASSVAVLALCFALGGLAVRRRGSS
jgi:hypothetical protein